LCGSSGGKKLKKNEVQRFQNKRAKPKSMALTLAAKISNILGTMNGIIHYNS
jgi:hypothetical protein